MGCGAEANGARAGGAAELKRVVGLPTYVFSLIDEWKAEAAAGGVEIIDFGVGSPDIPTPDPVIDELVRAARDPATHGYPTSPGMPELRAALTAWYARRYGVQLDAESQTLVTWGASEALAHLPWVLLGSGDGALVPEPCYPIHRYAVLFSGARPIGVPMWAAVEGEQDDDGALFARLVAACETAPVPPRLALLSFPHNPTTRCVGLPFFERLVDFARARDLVLIHDFAYADIAFDGFRPPSILQVPGAAEVAVELVSLSKSHNMAGWRLGFVAGNAQVVGALRALKSYLDYGVSRAVQLAALAALEAGDDVPRTMTRLYQQRRDVLCDGLRDIGWPVAKPRGTMFVWAPIPERFRAMGSMRFAKLLFDRARVAVSPGVSFGVAGEGHVRFALVQPEDRIRTALAAMADALHAGPPPMP